MNNNTAAVETETTTENTEADAAEAAHYDAMAERAFAMRCAEGF